MSLEVAYPYDRATLEPLPLRAAQIWLVAEQVRQKLQHGRRTPCLDVARMVREAGQVVVNGSKIRTHWDLERGLSDGMGREALGVTETDPALSNTLLISLNAPLIADREYLLRSTLAHELGHVLFDGPSMLRQVSSQRLAMVTPDEGHLVRGVRRGDQVNWREFRANEFMGALLVPCAALHRALVSASIAVGLPLVDGGGALPMPRQSADPERFEHVLQDLAERFGVSADFIAYRLRRYALVR